MLQKIKYKLSNDLDIQQVDPQSGKIKRFPPVPHSILSKHFS